jgi:flagellar biosynthesis GTPase FlhF
MDPRKETQKQIPDEELKPQESKKSELQSLRETEKQQLEVTKTQKITKLRGQIATQEQMIDKMRRENERIKEKVKSVVISTREAELEMALRLSQLDSSQSRGLSEHEIDVSSIQSLPLFTLDYPQDCIICKRLIPEEHIVKSLPLCGHIFHQPCLDTFLLTHTTCPECLTPALED